MDSHDVPPLLATPPQTVVPPTLPGSIRPGNSGGGWPTVVGVIALVFGIMAALGGLCGIVSALFIRAFFTMIGMEDQLSQDPNLAHLDTWAIPLAVLNLAGMLVAGLLIYAAVLTLRRKRMAGSWMVRWSWTKIIFVVVMAMVTFLMQREQFEAMTAAAAQAGTPGTPGSAGAPPAVLSMITTAMPIITFVLSVIWGWVLPVFMLIWFGRSKIRQEVAAWS